MATPLRVAVIGTGYFSQFHLDAWSRMPDVELVAVCSLDIEEARRAADAHGAPVAVASMAKLLTAAKPDLIDIVAPPAAHLALISEAAAAGIDVICQKPFCGSLAQARKAADIADTAGIALVVHENFRFQPWYGEIKRQLEAGALGEPYQLSFRLRPGDGQGPDAYLDRQPYFQTMERFLVHETAIHFIDVFRYLMGEVTRVFAALSRLNPVIQGEDAGLILFDFAGPARGVFDGNRLADHAAENRRLTMGELSLEGSQASLRLDGDGGLFLREHGRNEERALPYSWANRAFAGNAVFRLQAHVVRHLRSGAPLVNNARAYLTNLEIEEAVYQSNATGRWVNL